MSLKLLLYAAFSSILSWYCFAVFDFLVAFIIPKYFQVSNNLYIPIAFLVFGSGYFLRPIGAVIWGHIGDRYGRTKAISSSLMVLGLATLSFSFLPTVDTIGVFASVLFVLVRVIQGLASGGEVGGTLLFNFENAKQNKKGYAGGLLNSIVTTGILLGAVVSMILSHLSSESELWRIPFLVGGLVVISGLIYKKHIPDTKEFINLKKEEIVKYPFIETLRLFYKQIIYAILLTAFPSLVFYIHYVYLPTILERLPGFTSGLARVGSTGSLLFLVVSLTVSGFFSDKFGYDKLMKIGALLLMMLNLLFFSLLNQLSVVQVLVFQALFGIFLGMFNGPWCAFVSKAFQTQVRYSSVGIIQTVSQAIFSGTAPLIGFWIVGFNNGMIFLGIYLGIWSLLGYWSVSKLEEIYDREIIV